MAQQKAVTILTIEGIEKFLKDNGSERNRENFDTVLEWIATKATPKQIRQIEIAAKKKLNEFNERSAEPLRKNLSLAKQKSGNIILLEQFYLNGKSTSRSLSNKSLEKIDLSEYSISPKVQAYLDAHLK